MKSKVLEDKLSYIKEYFRQTTVHGIRYVVDGETILEKLIWVAAMAIAFTCAAYLTYSSVMEAEEHPIATTTEVLTIDNIPFPAVTVAAGGGQERTPPFRFVADILNVLKFDCTNANEEKDIQECFTDTKKVRQDFSPLIRSTINTIYAIWLKQIPISYSATDWIREMTAQSDSYLRLLLEAFCKVNGSAFNSTGSLEENTLTTLEQNFMVTRELYRNNTLKFVKSLEDYLDENAPPCSFDTLGSLPIKATLSTMLLLDVKANETMPSIYNNDYLELGLGSLLAMSYYSMRPKTGDYMKFNFGQQLQFTDESGNLISVADGILTHKLKDDIDLSVVDIYNFMKHLDEIEMTSAANYSSQFLSGKLCQECCILDYMPENHALLLKAMKYARQGGSFYKTIKNNNPYINDISEALNSYNYTKNICTYGYPHFDPLILANYFGAEKENLYAYKDCNVFSPIITPVGLAYSFNSTELWETFIETEGILAFNEEYRTAAPTYEDDDHSCKLKPGVENQLQFILRQSYLNVLTHTKTPFKVAIHSPNDLPDKFINLIPGYKYTITVTPAKLSSDTEIGELPLNKRGCQPDTKNYDSKIFNRYSYSRCVYECRLNDASEEMGCHPWDQWLTFDNISKICNKDDAPVVVNFMKSYETEQCDHCLPDCNSTTYAYSVRHEKLDDCNSGYCHERETIVRLHPLLAFLSDPTSIYNTHGGIWEGACQREQSHQAQVTVEFATNTVTHIRRIRRTSFTDQMASLGMQNSRNYTGMISNRQWQFIMKLGGVVGLFTGMSFLSVVELLVWILKWGTRCSKKSRIPSHNGGLMDMEVEKRKKNKYLEF